MAELTVTFVVEKLRKLIASEGTFLAEVGDEIQGIELELRRMHSFLPDADAKQETDESVKKWVKEIVEVAFQVEDVIDGFIQRFGSVNRRSGFRNSFKRYVALPSELQARRGIIKDIETIRTKILDISESRSACGIESSPRVSDEERLLERRRVAESDDSAEVVVGFEKDAEKLENLLLLGVERRRVTVSVVGRGGVGKTTLARKVYDSIVPGAFDCRVWIGLARGSKSREILEDIMWKAMGTRKEKMEAMFSDELEERLRQFLEQRRYLVVLDDVASAELWDQINPHLPNANNGSRVLITTRFPDVATSALPCFPPHDLQGLSEEESWELLARKAVLKTEACGGEMVAVRKRIVGRCCSSGLPLAVVLAGGLLLGKACNPSSWLDSIAGVDWEEGGKRELGILELSYRELPHRLKRCFLYLSGFPQGYEIRAEKLIGLWIAEGFVPNVQSESLEETGERYLKELIQRSMIRVSTRNVQGDIETCGVHHLLHEFSISKSGEVGFFHVHGVTDNSNIRRVAIHGEAATAMECEVETRQSIRTLLTFTSSPSRSKLDLKSCRLVRVVDLEGLPINSLPKEIEQMIHLRYLGLRDTALKRLPSSTGRLYNLETLDVRGTQVSFIPDGVWVIGTLRHVLGSWLESPPRIGVECGPSHLRTLEAVAAGTWVESSLYRLRNLRKLLVFGIEADGSYSGSMSRNLVKLQEMETLLLSSGAGPLPIDLLSTIQSHDRLKVMSLRGSLARCLDFDGLPPNLVKLSLRSTRLTDRFVVAAANLRSLKVLVLEKGSYVGTEMVCASGSFPRLQELCLEDLPRLRRWEVEKKAMPCLVYLRIVECPALLEVPSGLENLPKLQRLELKGMSPSFRNDLGGKSRKKIQHVSSVSVDGNVLR